MRIIRLLASGILVVLLSLLTLGAPASAHTGFESSDPADGAVIDVPLEVITLVFTGEAEPTGDGFQVLDGSGTVHSPIESSTADGLTWVLRFDPPITGGTAGMRWTVKAPDAHPISGSFSFTVTAPSPEPVGAAQEPVEEQEVVAPGAVVAPDLESFLLTDGDPTSTPLRVGAIGRMITLVGTLVGVGALIFAAAVLRGARRDVHHVMHWVRRAGVFVVVGALVELVAQLAVDGGGQWSAVWSPASLGSVLFSSFGIAFGLRVAGGTAMATGAGLGTTLAHEVRDPVVAIKDFAGIGAGPAMNVWPVEPTDSSAEQGDSGREPYVHRGDHAWVPSVDSVGAMLGALAVVAAHLFDGHTVTKGDRILTALADVVHVAGGAVWAGGVMMLASVLWRRHRQGRDVRALQLAVRFSVVAMLALVAVGVAGVLLTVIVLDSPSELWATEWGRLLMLKTLFVFAAAAAGGYNHSVLIPQMNEAPDSPALAAHFRTVITVEAVALVAVLVVTAFLMGAAS